MSNQDFSHYFKTLEHLKTIDVYRVLDLFNVDNHCIGHAIKNCYAVGNVAQKTKHKTYKKQSVVCCVI